MATNDTRISEWVSESTELSADEQQQVSDLGLEYLRRILTSWVYDVAVETDLTELTRLSLQTGQQIYLKREDQQPVHSFKIRGAYNRLCQLTEQQKSLGVIAASAGNHAQGLALAARHLGIKATIVMPITTPEIKVDNVRRLGGEVRLLGKSFNEAAQAAKQAAQREQKTIIHPFDDSFVIAGQGTVAKELMQQLPDVDAVFVPVGGGGLLAGMAVYIKQLNPNIRVIGVEAEDSACLAAALQNGTPVDLARVGLFADGVAVKRIGNQTFSLIRHFCDQVITVSSDEICAAIKEIFEQTRVIAEPAGALSLAGLLKYCQRAQGKQKLAAVLSGANMNFHSLRYVSERCELGEQKEAVLAVEIPEQKGSFRKFCKALGGKAITEFNYRGDGREQAHIFVGVRVTQGNCELVQLISDLRKQGYKVNDLTSNELAKLHVRYMIGGHNRQQAKTERLFSFEFPEYPGALEIFLDTLGAHWNISLFHYRNHGAAFGQVLAGVEIDARDELAFFRHLHDLGYQFQEETDNPAYQLFLGN
ncbi:threonine ammonia-lyase, biosynthetic [Thalassotalea ponticola]|uniref:threonine ammonia-lyase, biosynthetic n=1 Tax=Thalassotalea ponticola TaxID=1523392 RepID=UPI0025B38725|nr:threonine ammonia-lyase, biosynthetic [Thalassotalea ponticola]MDN3652472.1 threonine ammonia-lyase, biosynthetic [Thalassotalea ponticola]